MIAITSEGLEAAFREANRRIRDSEISMWDMRVILLAAFPRPTDDGATDTPPPVAAGAESATSTVAPSSPHLREALGELAADWRSLPRDPDSVATTVLRHCGAQLVSILASYPVAGATPAIDRDQIAAVLREHLWIPSESRCSCGDEHIEFVSHHQADAILALIEGPQ